MRKIGITARVNMILSFWFMFWLLFLLSFMGLTKTLFFLDSRQSYMTTHVEGHITVVTNDTTSRPRRVVGKKYEYTYTYEGHSYDGKVTGRLPQIYFEEQKVDVLLDPHNPGVSRLSDTWNVTIPPWFSVGLDAVTMGIFVWLCFNAKARIEMLQEGVMRSAKVDKKGRTLFFGGGKFVVIRRKIRNVFAYREVDSVPIVHHKTKLSVFITFNFFTARFDESEGVWRSNILLVIFKLLILALVLSTGVHAWFSTTV